MKTLLWCAGVQLAIDDSRYGFAAVLPSKVTDALEPGDNRSRRRFRATWARAGWRLAVFDAYVGAPTPYSVRPPSPSRHCWPHHGPSLGQCTKGEGAGGGGCGFVGAGSEWRAGDVWQGPAGWQPPLALPGLSGPRNIAQPLLILFIQV